MDDIISENAPQSKQCAKCKQYKPLHSFGRNKQYPDGLYHLCKECRNARSRELYVPKLRPTLPDGYKRCSECKELFPATLEFFHSNPNQSDGLRSECKPCRKIQEVRNAYLNKQESKQEKKCPVCKQIKSIDAFSIARGRYDGRNSRCKECVNHLYNAKQPKKMPDNIRIKRCTECSQVKPATIEYFHKQPSGKFGLKGRCKVCIALARKLSRSSDIEYNRWRYKHDPESYKIHVRNRKSRKKAVAGKHTPAQIQQQYHNQKGKCYYCKTKIKWGEHHVEHTFPLSRVTGTDIPANDIAYLVISCKPCNMKKGNKFPWEFPEGGRLL